MRMWMAILFMCFGSMQASEVGTVNEESVAPQYLYKVLTYELWQKSQNEPVLCLPQMDDAFIHFSTESQVDKTAAKFFADVPKYVILKIDRGQLQGHLVYESNPGSTSKYYHLYSGSIPRSAVVEYHVVSKVE